MEAHLGFVMHRAGLHGPQSTFLKGWEGSPYSPQLSNPEPLTERRVVHFHQVNESFLFLKEGWNIFSCFKTSLRERFKHTQINKTVLEQVS